MQGSVNVSIGYTEYVRTVAAYANSWILQGTDSESTGNDNLDWDNCQQNSWINLLADTGYSHYPSTWYVYGLHNVWYAYYGSRYSSYSFSRPAVTITASDKTNVQSVKLRLTGRSTYYWYNAGAQGGYYNSGYIAYDVSEDPNKYTDALDLYSNFEPQGTISMAAFNAQYAAGGGTYSAVFSDVAARSLYLDLDKTIFTGMTGTTCYIWLKPHYEIFPWLSQFATYGGYMYQQVSNYPSLVFYY